MLLKKTRREYKDVSLNQKCQRHSMNRIQSQNRRIGTYEINKNYLSCSDDKISIQNNGSDRLALGISRVNCKKHLS